MESVFEGINWLAVLACVAAGQVLLTVWFVVLFGEPWARAYGGEGMTKAQHTKEVPGYTYAVGAVCVLVLTLVVAVLQAGLGVQSIGGALKLAGFLALVFLAMALPGYAFLKRWNAFFLAAGSQVVVLVAVSIILAVWR